MMSGVPLKTCWTFKKFWNNKFYYKAASCWYFYWTCCTIKVSCEVTFVLKEHKYKFALHCGIYCILKIPHYTLYTFIVFSLTCQNLLLCWKLPLLWGGNSLINISSFYSLLHSWYKHAMSVVSMKCLHTATSIVSVWSLAMECGGLCLPWSF
jgi:hypothetical protein